MAGKYRLTTLGCKVNQYESEQLRELLQTLGLRPAAEGEEADWAVVNTCAVTCGAAAKSRQAIRKLSAAKARHLVVVGCYATADPQHAVAIEGATHVLGHQSDVLVELRELVSRWLADDQGLVGDDTGATPPDLVRSERRLAGVSAGAPPEPGPPPLPDGSMSTTTSISISRHRPIVNRLPRLMGPIREFAERARAFLKIQDGCDAHCSYCIIPRLRANLHSKPVEDVVAEARQLAASGHREIVLTGVFLGAYQRPSARRVLWSPGPSPLAGLVEALAGVEGLDRLRLSSLEPGDVDDALLDVLARHQVCVPHLHLPVQAGSADVLRRMNRQYTVDDFLAMVERVRNALDRPAISTDIIVGFPGETDEMFAQTLSLAQQVRFCKIHAFPFSPRPGTAAACWGEQFVDGHVVKERMVELRKLERQLAHAYQSQFVGETTRVLVEGVSPCGDGAETAGPPEVLAHGRSDRYFEVFFEAAGVSARDLVIVRLDRVASGRVHGHCIGAGV